MRDLKKLPDEAVLTFQEWCEINTLSEATGVRIKKEGRGPTFIQMSSRRIGVTVQANRDWQKSRALRPARPAAA